MSIITVVSLKLIIFRWKGSYIKYQLIIIEINDNNNNSNNNNNNNDNINNNDNNNRIFGYFLMELLFLLV